MKFAAILGAVATLIAILVELFNDLAAKSHYQSLKTAPHG